MIYTENDKCQQTFSPRLDGMLLQLEGKSSGWSQFPHLEKKKYSRLKVTLLPRGGEESHIKKGRGCLSHLLGIKKAVLVALGVFSFKNTVGAFCPTFYGIKLCQEKMSCSRIGNS